MNKFYWDEDTLHDMLYTDEVGIYNFCHDNTDWGDMDDLEEIVEDFTRQLRQAEDKYYGKLRKMRHTDLCEVIIELKKLTANI